MESLNLSCIEERWNAFLSELIEADKLPEVGTKSANKPFIPNSLEKQSTRPTDDNWNRPVWIAHLKVWLSPSKVGSTTKFYNIHSYFLNSGNNLKTKIFIRNIRHAESPQTFKPARFLHKKTTFLPEH